MAWFWCQWRWLYITCNWEWKNGEKWWWRQWWEKLKQQWWAKGKGEKCLSNHNCHHHLWDSLQSPPNISVVRWPTAATFLSHRSDVTSTSPKKFTDTVFFPPTVPVSVLCYVNAHPPTWTWTVRASTILTVPTAPIHCGSDAPKAVKWMVSVFHSFKSSLIKEHSLSLDGKVLPPLVCLYQNKMLLHFGVQLRLFDHLHPSSPKLDPPPVSSTQPQWP